MSLELLQLNSLNPSEYEAFCDSYTDLMKQFKIPLEHYNPLLEILQGFYDDLDTTLMAIYDSQNAVAALEFLIQYQDKLRVIQSEHLKAVNDQASNIVNSIDSEFHLQLKSPYLDIPITLSYHGVAEAVVKDIYSLLRKKDPILHSALHEHETLLPSKKLRAIRKTIQTTIDFGINKAVVYTITELTNYLKSDKNLVKTLSRKQTLFVFELLYISDILKEVKLANHIVGSDFALPTKQTTKFKPTSWVTDTDKVAFIRALVKNKGRMDRHNEVIA